MGACTGPQARNLSLFGQLQEVHRSISTLLPRLPPSAAASLGYYASPPLMYSASQALWQCMCWRFVV